ncbi:MAG: hypothetical protein GWO24_29500, partial [Akkermansiaceae bacterium]|nr:hypothetical protein [Akkermansiaceae bacterium]
FDRSLPAAECLRRLEALLTLREGCLCYEKTWGFGVVRAVDSFYKQVRIDFDRKRDHEMSLAYAAEALNLIGEDHILALKYRDPEAIDRMVREEPAEVIRTTLRSYGPRTVAELQAELVPNVVPEMKWKRFWDAARAALKKDPLVDLPA